MFEKIKEKLLDYVDYPAENIMPDTQFIKDLEMNSFDIVTMIGELEEELEIQFDQEMLSSISTVGELVALIEELKK